MLTSSSDIFKIPWIFVACVPVPRSWGCYQIKRRTLHTRHCSSLLPFLSPLGRFPNKCELVVGDWERGDYTQPQAHKISGTSHFKFRGMSWIRLSPQTCSEHSLHDEKSGWCFHWRGPFTSNMVESFNTFSSVSHFILSTIITISKLTSKVGRLNFKLQMENLSVYSV